MTLAVTEALSPNTPNLDMTLAVAEALSPNKPNLDMILAVAEALSPNNPNLDMTLAVAEALNPNKPKPKPDYPSDLNRDYFVGGNTFIMLPVEGGTDHGILKVILF